MTAALMAVPAADMRRYEELKGEERRRQAAGEDVQIRYLPDEDELRILPRQRAAA